MIVRNSDIKMPDGRHFTRIDTLELKGQIERKLGRQKADKYFSLLNRLLSLKLRKSEFHKLCIATIGRENLCLHNHFIGSILKNACLSKTPPIKEHKEERPLESKVTNGYQRSCLQSLCRDVFPQSPRKGRTPNLRDRKFRDRLSPLGPHGKIHSLGGEDSVPKIQEQHSATELLSLGSRPPAEVNSVEDGEEVEQDFGSPSIHSRSPVKAPLGIPMNIKVARKSLSDASTSDLHLDSCHSSGELPDATSLRNMLEQKLNMNGLNISGDCVDLLNSSLDVFLKRLIKPCLELASSRAENTRLNQFHKETSFLNGTGPVRCIQKPSKSSSATILDFRVAMDLNPHLLGVDWPIQLEKLYLRALEE